MVTARHNLPSSKQDEYSVNTTNRMRSSIKRPRAPIACIRCHHKKIRCDGEHPNCARCTQGGILCAYPSSRRSRNTPPTSMDPFIDNLSQLESKIQRIKANLKIQRSLFLSFNIVDVAMATSSHLDSHGSKLKNTKNSTSSEFHPSCMPNDKQKNQPPSETSRKRSNPSSQSQDSKRRKRPLATETTPKSTPSSSKLLKTTIPISSHEYIVPSPSSAIPQNYLSPGLDPFSCQTDWIHSSSDGLRNDIIPHVIYSGQPQQLHHHSIYNTYQQHPLFLPEHPSPVTTPDYTDDSNGKNNPSTSTPATSFHDINLNTIDNCNKLDTHHHYSLSSSTFSSNTLSSDPTISSPSGTSLGHFPASTPPYPQTTSCQMINLYNHLTMDDLISFDSQNTGMPLIENTVWYC